MKIRKLVLAGTATVGIAALLAGCGSAPTATTTPSASAIAGFKPCILSDQGGFDDRSFNQLGWEGLQQASQELGVTPIKVQSKTKTDYAPNLKNLVDQGCSLIVSVGFAIAADTGVSAKANPKVHYISIDDPVLDSNFKPVSPTNVKPLLYDTAQAAFLAGYLSAGYSKTKVLGTFGGGNYPTVSIFMDGYKQGVDYYNTQNSTSVKLLGWNGSDGSFTGGFVANDTARNIAQGLIDQNADIILPVGGPIYQSAAAAIKDSGKDIALIGVDADVTLTDPSVANILLTSIMKQIKPSVYQSVLASGKGKFDTTTYVGTLNNGGVGIAPYHNFDSKVPADLKKKVTDLQQAIIDGKVPVKSYLAK